MDQNNEVVPLWDESLVPSAPPRRPHTATNTSQNDAKKEQEGQTTNNVDLSILSKSNLSVDAQEWFPANYAPMSSAPVSFIQNRLQRAKINTSEGEQNGFVGHNTNTALDTTKLKEIVNELIYDPGQYDRVVDTFLHILEPYSQDFNVCNSVTDMLFEFALSNENFRYNAARLFSHIQEHCPLVRTRLHVLCEKELSLFREKTGLTMFLAELYTQLHFENLFGKSLLCALRNLLSSGEPNDIKCLLQALKLCGSSLDMCDKVAMDDIFSQMQSARSRLTSNILNLMDVVVEWRNRQWDQGSPVPTASNHTINGFTHHTDYAVVLSPEESDFYYETFNEGSDDPDELCDPEPEMDEEIQQAFKEFVQFSKR